MLTLVVRDPQMIPEVHSSNNGLARPLEERKSYWAVPLKSRTGKYPSVDDLQQLWSCIWGSLRLSMYVDASFYHDEESGAVVMQLVPDAKCIEDRGIGYDVYCQQCRVVLEDLVLPIFTALLTASHNCRGNMVKALWRSDVLDVILPLDLPCREDILHSVRQQERQKETHRRWGWLEGIRDSVYASLGGQLVTQ